MGFGLSDGEGCERFWSTLKRLIPSLRISGVHLNHFLCFNILISFHSATVVAGCWIARSFTTRTTVFVN